MSVDFGGSADLTRVGGFQRISQGLLVEFGGSVESQESADLWIVQGLEDFVFVTCSTLFA